jgi:hypothetical protein
MYISIRYIEIRFIVNVIHSLTNIAYYYTIRLNFVRIQQIKTSRASSTKTDLLDVCKT